MSKGAAYITMRVSTHERDCRITGGEFSGRETAQPTGDKEAARSKYAPHEGAREVARRARRLSKGGQA